MKNITKKFLLQLPKRKYNATSIYDSIIIVDSGEEHDSGYTVMYLVGCIDGKPIEIIEDGCDSINWKFDGLRPIIGTDMLYPSGLVQFFGVDCKLKIASSYSTTVIELIKKNE